jgi:hypothetical protein
MKNSLCPTRTRNAILCLSRLVLPPILAGGMAIGCGPQVAQAPQSPQSPQSSSSPQAPQAPQGPQSSLVGTWRTIVPPSTVDGVPVAGATITISIMANGQYDQTGVPQNVSSGGTQTMQAGPYQMVAPNSIIFRVTNYSPKTRIVLVPCGIPNDPVCNVQRVENAAKPTDSEYAYTFNGPNTLMLNNQAGSYTFTRVTQ